MTFNIETLKLIIRPRYIWLISGVISVLTFLIFVMVLFNTFRSKAFSLAGQSKASIALNDDEMAIRTSSIEQEITDLEQQFLTLTPKKSYIVINTAANEFSLFNNQQLVKKDKCSTGSYILLKNDKNQQWMFKTPKGEFKIRNKTIKPVWKRPDWAFIEEGLPVPSMNHPSRYEYGVLGDYSLALGDGYLIHGTLYQRFLGLPVTHGCIRLNDENLKLVFNQLHTGDKVFIF